MDFDEMSSVIRARISAIPLENHDVAEPESGQRTESIGDVSKSKPQATEQGPARDTKPTKDKKQQAPNSKSRQTPSKKPKQEPDSAAAQQSKAPAEAKVKEGTTKGQEDAPKEIPKPVSGKSEEAKPKSQDKPKKKAKIETDTLRMVEGFRCLPQHIYEALTDQRLVSVYTQSPAVIDAKEGGSFSLFGGSVTGKFIALEPGKKIVESWRFNNEWEPDHFSTVTIKISMQSYGITRLELVQENIPVYDKYLNRDVPEKVKNGWERFFWERIRGVMGYGKAPVEGQGSEDD